jgi:class 3 adenylate cyclase
VTKTSPLLAMILEIQTLRRTTRTFLETYVGENAGAKVLDGTIKRGMGETIPCAILFCDLRGFTALSNSLDSDRTKAGRVEIRCGIALHVGDVMYGNIGGRIRPVNLASRIEKLCADLDEEILMSAAFADLLDFPVRNKGTHTFKGVSDGQLVFAPA